MMGPRRPTRVEGGVAWVPGADGVDVPIAADYFPELVDVSGMMPPPGTHADVMSQFGGAPAATMVSGAPAPDLSALEQLAQPNAALAGANLAPGTSADVMSQFDVTKQLGEKPIGKNMPTVRGAIAGAEVGGATHLDWNAPPPAAPAWDHGLDTRFFRERSTYFDGRVPLPAGASMRDVPFGVEATARQREGAAQAQSVGYVPPTATLGAAPNGRAGMSVSPGGPGVQIVNQRGRAGRVPPRTNAPLTEPEQENVASYREDAATVGALADTRSQYSQDLLAQQRQADEQFAQLRARQDEERQLAETRIQERVGALDRSIREVRNGRIDPNRWMNSRDTGTHVLAGIGIALGSIGQALTGSNSNVALDIINDAISRDIAAQQDNLANQRASNDDERGQIAQARQDYGDLQQNQAAQRAMHWEAAARQVDQFGQGLQNEEQRAQAELLGNEMRRRANEAFMQFQDRENTLAAQWARAHRPRGGGQTAVLPNGQIVTPRNGRTWSVEEAQHLDALNAQITAPRAEVDGVSVRVADSQDLTRVQNARGGGEQGNRAREQLSRERQELSHREEAISQVDASLSETERLIRESGGDVPGVGVAQSVARALMGRAGADMLTSREGLDLRRSVTQTNSQIMHAITGAGMSDREREIYSSMLPNADDISESNFVAAVQQQRRAAEALRTRIRAGFSREAVEANDANIRAAAPASSFRPGTR